MKFFTKSVLACGFMALPLFAGEQFGGIGVTIYQVQEGAHIAEVIPGTPAAETKLQSGDVIIAVDGVSLKGKDLDFSKDKLRGEKNKPLEITYVSAGDTNSVILRRTQMTIKNFEEKEVKAWYGDKEKLNAQELETYASATENSKQLVAVLRYGNLISGDAVQANDLEGVYIEKVDEFAPKPKKQNANANSGIKLRGFSRKSVSFSLKTPGTAVVTILTAEGNEIAQVRVENALAGINTAYYDGTTLPAGRYMVNIEQNSAVFGKFAILK